MAVRLRPGPLFRTHLHINKNNTTKKEGITMLNQDPQEKNSKLKPIIKKAAEDAQQIVYKKYNLNKGEHQTGLCHEIWEEQKKILKEKNIDWKSPPEMNPNVMFD